MRTRRERRPVEAFGMSFLDTICCGFGALILLLVLNKQAEPRLTEERESELRGAIARLQQELFDLRGEARVLNRTLSAATEQLSEDKRKLARLRGDLSEIPGRFAASQERSAVKNTIEGELAEARQTLTEEMQRLLGAGYRRAAGDTTVGGIPVDSEYIIFVVDTSGSMQRYNWRFALEKVQETLEIYPTVKGIQVLNDMGEPLFSQYSSKWIPDSAGRRRAILRRLATWRPFSNSSPVEGIERAIRTFYAADKKISIYVFGDEFSGASIEAAVASVGHLNRLDARGQRLVRIHAVGFPIEPRLLAGRDNTSTRFATLMRILCERNGGTFVALTH